MGEAPNTKVFSPGQDFRQLMPRLKKEQKKVASLWGKMETGYQTCGLSSRKGRKAKRRRGREEEERKRESKRPELQAG